MSDAVDIRIRPSGPYLVRGPITLHDADGTHSKIGFQAATQAVSES